MCGNGSVELKKLDVSHVVQKQLRIKRTTYSSAYQLNVSPPSRVVSLSRSLQLTQCVPVLVKVYQINIQRHPNRNVTFGRVKRNKYHRVSFSLYKCVSGVRRWCWAQISNTRKTSRSIPPHRTFSECSKSQIKTKARREIGERRWRRTPTNIHMAH